MHLIEPITAEECETFRGDYVCVIMKDDSRHYGILSRTDRSRLILNDHESAGGHSGAAPKSGSSKATGSAKTKANGKSKSARTKKQTPPVPPVQLAEIKEAGPEWETESDSPSYGERTVLNLSEISALYPAWL